MANEDENLVEKLREVEALLEEYEKKLHLDKITLKEPRMDISREEMEAMDIRDLDYLRWEYGAYALFIQKEINRLSSRFTWTDTNLKRYLEYNANSYEGFQWNERQAAALNCSDYAQKLHTLKCKTKMALDRLSFLPEKIKFLSDILRDICFTRRKYKDE